MRYTPLMSVTNLQFQGLLLSGHYCKWSGLGQLPELYRGAYRQRVFSVATTVTRMLKMFGKLRG